MDKYESQQIKGLAIILMYIHHLFGCGSFLIIEESNTVLVGHRGAILATGAKICISIFAIVSGYGFGKSYIVCKDEKRWFIKRIVSFLLTYWIMLFLIAIPYLLIVHKFNPSYFLINLFALLHNDEMLYLSFSWYIKVYLEVLLVLPIIKRLNQKLNPFEEIFVNIILPCTLSMFLIDTEANYIGFRENLTSSIRLLLIWYPVFYIGIIFSKYHILEMVEEKFIYKYWESGIRKNLNKFIMLLLIFQLLFYRSKNKFAYYTDVIVSGFFLLFAWVLIHKCKTHFIPKILEFLGIYSFQYWLLSGMFFLNTTEFQWILFIPRSPILILIWSFILISPFAIIMRKISDLILKQIFS